MNDSIIQNDLGAVRGKVHKCQSNERRFNYNSKDSLNGIAVITINLKLRIRRLIFKQKSEI
jgi:hypothetical protein